MDNEFINLTTENLPDEHLSCIIRSKKPHPGVEGKRQFGFEVVDTTNNGYELLALSFDGTTPQFTENAKSLKIESQELTIFYTMQCPYIHKYIEMIKAYCETNSTPLSLIQVDTLQKAKELPCVFNNWGVFYKGNFETVNLLDANYLKRILKK